MSTVDPFWEEMHRQAATHPTEVMVLEREIVEAAKAERLATLEYDQRTTMSNWKASVDTRLRRVTAVDALIEFEKRGVQP